MPSSEQIVFHATGDTSIRYSFYCPDLQAQSVQLECAGQQACGPQQWSLHAF